MKKGFLIMLAVLTIGFAHAQSGAYIQGGVGVSHKNFTQNLELGAIKGQNQFSVVGETFKTANNTRYEDRQFYAGVKYSRNFNSGLQASGAALVHLNDGTYDLKFVPQLGYNLKLSNAIVLQPVVSTPISEGTNLFRPFGLGAGVNLQVRL